MSDKYFSHEVEIACDPETIFEYVTNPNRWHEWYPSSQPTNEEYKAQETGQKFEILTVQRPIKALPFEITKQLAYTVIKSEPASIWEISASSDLVNSTTTYTLQKIKKGTLFKREFKYTTKGWLKIIEPILLRKSIFSQAGEGLNNLKARIESES